MPRKTRAASLPTKDAILKWLESAEGKVGKREIARAFGVKGEGRVALKALLADMSDEGLITKGKGRRVRPAHRLPPVAALDIVDRDTDGELMARPSTWEEEAPPPSIVLAALDERRGPALGVGERVLARLKPIDDPSSRYAYEARPIRRLGQSAHRVLGVFVEAGREGRIRPVDRKSRFELKVAEADRAGARPGDLVLSELKGGGGLGLKAARVVERFGSLDEPQTISLIAIHTHGIPTNFSGAALAEAAEAAPAPLGRRDDLRQLPLVTIDPEDARDHDDAVHAEADSDPKNPGGFVVTVAIADVAHYVKPNSALDREALKRGNSTYFPDRVVPMLPERLSNELCSLEEGKDRAVIAVRMVFERNGKKRSHAFVRGLMRSAASLSYGDVQRAIDGKPDARTAPLLEPVIRPLYAAFAALDEARAARAPLDLDLPEFRVEIGPEGRVRTIAKRERFAAHRLIEEFMIQANVAAAETLEARRVPLMYRVHEPPAREKLVALSDFLNSIGINAPKGKGLTTREFNHLLKKAEQTAALGPMVSEIILRSQSQAYYGPENKGHFGLHLARYAHFTSPIRRYADLIVHRALIRALNAGEDGLADAAISLLARVGEEISGAERRSMAAERDALNRYIAAYMADQLGASFAARVSGVTRFGLFVRLTETGADGLIPIGGLGNEYFHHDEATHALIGRDSGLTFRLGEALTVRLVEATPITGGLRFELVEGGTITTARPSRGAGRPRAGHQARRRATSPKTGGPARKRRR